MTNSEQQLINTFQEDSAYERLVLRTLAEVEAKESGGMTFVHDLRGDRPHVNITMTATHGASAAVRAVQKFRILLFGAAYKILDLVVELVLQLNHMPRPAGRWTFDEKVRHLQVGCADLPASLKPYRLIWERVQQIYKNLLEARHSVIHRPATVSEDGTFQVEDRNGWPLRAVTAEEQWLFSLLMLDVGTLIVGGSPDPRMANTVMARLDGLTAHHGLPPTGVAEPAQVATLLVNLEPAGEKAWSLDLQRLREYVMQAHKTPVADLHLYRPGEPAPAFVARLDELPGDSLKFREETVPTLLTRACDRSGTSVTE